MTGFITETTFEGRLRNAVSMAWQVFARKVGGGLIPVNKEASMQLQYAYVLKQLLPLAVHTADEVVDIELETGVRTASGKNNIDVLVKGRSASGTSNIAIEMKCYRNITSSGGTRGAHDIFMKDIYEDLHVLEEYVDSEIVDRGVSLIMTDIERFAFPRSKKGQCWAYDTSHGYTFPGGEISVPIGGKPVRIMLRRSHSFNWEKYGDLWFVEVEGVATETAAAAVS